jgi:xylulokinase
MWAEQDPETFWDAVVNTTKSVLRQSRVSSHEVVSVSFSCQTPCLIPVQRDGQPLRPCISWIDARAVKQAEQVKKQIGVETVYQRTGVLLSSKDVICKLIWLKEAEESIFERAYKFVDLKDYLVHKLTGTFATDWTCASLTALFDIRRREWSDEFCKFVGVPIEKLPDARPSTDMVGEVTAWASERTGLRKGTQVVVGAGDVFCGALGSGTVEHGSSHLYLGGSSWVGVSVDKPVFDSGKRLLCSCHADPSKWMILGPMENAGVCLKWFLDQLGVSEANQAEGRGVSPYKILDEEAGSIEPGAMGLLFFPYMLGEKSPFFDPHAKGGFIGLALKHARPHLVRSILEGVAFHLRWIIESIEELGFNIQDMRLIGGGAQSSIWPQIIADVSQKEITIMEDPIHTGVLGAVLDCLVALEMQRDFKTAAHLLTKGKRLQPSEQSQYDKPYGIFKDHYTQVKDLYRRLSNI